jgi:hypothetical protein
MALAVGGEVAIARAQGTEAFRSVLAARVFPLMTAALAALIIWAMFADGIRRGMDHAVAFGPESEQNGMATAISQMVHGLGGYVAYYNVFEALAKVMDRGAESANDPKIIPNLTNRDLINEALAAALATPPPPEAFVVDTGLRTMVYDDIGIVDYDRIAFAIFGVNVEALYYLFFAILGLSTVAFLIQFWTSPVAQVVLLFNLLAFLLELHAGLFSRDMPSFWGMRHGSTLAILPAWHLALLVARRVRLTIPGLLLAVVQVAILVLAIRMRGSAAWTIVFLAALAIGLGLLFFRRFPAHERSFGNFARSLAAWPLLAALAGMLANNLYNDAKLHPAYFTDDIMPYHGLWHSAFIGLKTSPDFWPYVGASAEQAENGTLYSDRKAYDAALAYLRKINFLRTESDYISPWTHTYKMRLHDRIMRRMFFDTIQAHPLTALGLYLYWKPMYVVVASARLAWRMPVEVWLAAVAAAALLAGTFVALCQTTAAELRNVVLLALAAAGFASLPNLWAYVAHHTMADLLLSLFILVLLAVWAGFVTILLRRRRHADARP